MIEEPPLLTIRENRNRPSAAQVNALSQYPTGFLTDAMNGRGALAADIKPAALGQLPTRMCGPVLTCDCGPADVLALFAALSEATAGDIIVVATGQWQQCASVGDRVMGMARNAGAIGLITDGLVRDIEGIVAVGLPVFCTGLSPNSPYGKGPGTVGASIVVGGVSIASGAIVVSDDNGAVVVPFDRIDAVIEQVQHVAELEKELDARVDEGLVVPDTIVALLQSDQVKRV